MSLVAVEVEVVVVACARPFGVRAFILYARLVFCKMSPLFLHLLRDANLLYNMIAVTLCARRCFVSATPFCMRRATLYARRQVVCAFLVCRNGSVG